MDHAVSDQPHVGEQTTCPVCGSKNYRILIETDGEGYHILRKACREHGHEFGPYWVAFHPAFQGDAATRSEIERSVQSDAETGLHRLRRHIRAANLVVDEVQVLGIKIVAMIALGLLLIKAAWPSGSIDSQQHPMLELSRREFLLNVKGADKPAIQIQKAF